MTETFDLPRCRVGNLFGREEACGGEAERYSGEVHRDLDDREVLIHNLKCTRCGARGALVVRDGEIANEIGAFFGDPAPAQQLLESLYERFDGSCAAVARHLGMDPRPVRRTLIRIGVHESQSNLSSVLETANPEDWPKSEKRPNTRAVPDGGEVCGGK